MPQMSPMDWFLLFLYFFILYYLFFVMIYYLINMGMNSLNMKKSMGLNFNSMIYMMKWY